MSPATIVKPRDVVKRLFSVLPLRARDVIVSRYGLGKEVEKHTLDSIGKRYGITRERVRQIENYAMQAIRRSDIFSKEKSAFDEFEEALHELGGVVVEEELLQHLAKDKTTQNHVHLLLVLGEKFKREKEDEFFKRHWHVSDELVQKVHEALRKLHKGLTNNDLVSEVDVIARFLTHVADLDDHYKRDSVVKRWLSLCKAIGRNSLGEWGLFTSPNIKARGIRDYAFLVLRKHGSPIHFRDVALVIEKTFGRKAHVATVHNELIKDSRFVLVGRGLYALSEWGYMSGVVRDVIRKILEKHGPLTKDGITEKVLKERYVKENTIIVNLQNRKYFKKDKDGRYLVG